MKSLSFKEPWVHTYVERLLGLSTATKEAIIRALERSMTPRLKRDKKLSERFWSSFGAWEGPESAEELIQIIEGSRTLGTERESLDG
ncbi:MAG: hypothetical protein WAT74_00230 [Flavobacteriales bacterium]